MLVRFTKMQGLGNDFVVLDLITQRLRITEEIVRRLADRNFGVGFDQLLTIEPPTDPDLDFLYRIYNADGSEVEHCGNGARCFARYVIDKNLTGKKTISVQTQKGVIYLNLVDNNRVRVDMGKPVLEPAEVPFIADMVATSYSVAVNGELVDLGVVSMGNPHGVMVVEDIIKAPVELLGSSLERHERFPERANIGFMQIINPGEIGLRVYERGAGETLACGTGACAAVVVGRLRGLLNESVTVHLPGGDLQIQWPERSRSVIMTGDATTVFEGQIHI
jgi:diaminopimelate epimerase